MIKSENEKEFFLLVEQNRTEWNRIKHEFAESEHFRYFDVFPSSFRSSLSTLFY
jgi:hypothetical protein